MWYYLVITKVMVRSSVDFTVALVVSAYVKKKFLLYILTS